MSRTEATELLMSEREGGVFLVRDSNTIIGDYVLCVREDSKVSHYIINKIPQNESTVYRIGDQSFSTLPELLAFYKLHYLDTTPLRRPAPRKQEKVIGKFDFEGSVSKNCFPPDRFFCEVKLIYCFFFIQDQDDLPFRKGEILFIISKDEEQWWTAKNMVGQTGQIPVPYIQKVCVFNF